MENAFTAPCAPVEIEVIGKHNSFFTCKSAEWKTGCFFGNGGRQADRKLKLNSKF
jgi:hypothetical protein